MYTVYENEVMGLLALPSPLNSQTCVDSNPAGTHNISLPFKSYPLLRCVSTASHNLKVGEIQHITSTTSPKPTFINGMLWYQCFFLNRLWLGHNPFLAVMFSPL